ncbi:MAG: hypothetical protein HY901_09765 [Deltaproteobacteria bacterium]|nr:hypothetical protein [Deltaproteobacteria bacterium]
MSKSPFVFKSAATLGFYNGFFADSARTLQTAIERVPASSIFYHLHFALFRRHFTTSEFINDFARWTRSTLGDEPLAELLAAVEPLDFTAIEDMRQALVRTIGDYVGRMEYTPSVGFKQRLCFQNCQSFIFPIGLTADTLGSFVAASQKAPAQSIFYHFVVAPLLEGKRDNDFTLWLRAEGYDKAAQKVQRLSPYSTDLYELGRRIGDVLQ